MSYLKVNADKVIAAAARIKTINARMREEFSDVSDAIGKLDGHWDSPAASNAIGKFHSIEEAYCEARYNVMDNFVAFLHHQVGEGYQQTEAVNVSLADQFK